MENHHVNQKLRIHKYMKNTARTNIGKTVKEMVGSPLTENAPLMNNLIIVDPNVGAFAVALNLLRKFQQSPIVACMIEATLMIQRRLVHHGVVFAYRMQWGCDQTQPTLALQSLSPLVIALAEFFPCASVRMVALCSEWQVAPSRTAAENPRR
jgi:hypothetical protein